MAGKIKTPKGAMLGNPIIIDGKPGLHYKSGKTEEDLTPEQLVECVTGKKVVRIIYQSQWTEGQMAREALQEMYELKKALVI